MRCTPSTIVSLLIAASLLGCADPSAPAADPQSTEAPALAPAGPQEAEAPPSGPAGKGVDVTSSSYPAPHPSMPQIPRNGGVVLHDPVIVTVTFPNDPYEAKLQAFGDQVGGLDWWTTVHAGYGVGPATSGGHVVIPTAPAATLSDSDVTRWLAAKIGDATLPAPTDQTIYLLYYPKATTILLDQGEASCQVFLGYHSTITVSWQGNSIPIAYAVINRCDGGDLDQVTATSSHELTEASTDPHPIDDKQAGWVTLGENAWTGLGGENADMCAAVGHATEAGWALTRVWNNLTAADGDQPCLPVPASSLPYYNAGVVHDVLSVSPGGTASTEVDCYSFGPLPSSMSLEVRVAQGSPLGVSFDRKTCTNGDRVRMTFSMQSSARHGYDHAYTLVSSVGSESAHLWRGLVHVQ
jgi:hypothetical protein